MSEPLDSCILWTKAGNAGELTTVEKGIDFTIGGNPTYVPVKFGNGVRTDAITEEVKLLMDADYRTGKFIIESWIKTDYSVENGAASDADTHGIFNFGRATDATRTPSHFMFLFNNKLSWQVDTAAGTIFWQGGDAGMDWSANTATHLLYYCDFSTGTNNLRVYIDGVLAGQTNAVFGDQSLAGDFFWLGWGQNDFKKPFDGAHDNVKIYNNATETLLAQVIANRNNEGFPVGGFKLIDGGLKSPLLESNMIN